MYTVFHSNDFYFFKNRIAKLLYRNTPGSLLGPPRGGHIFLKNLTFSKKRIYTRVPTLECPLSSMSIKIRPDKTTPFPDDTKPDEVSTLRENMHIAANTAAVLKEYGADFDDPTPEDIDAANSVFKDFAQLAERQYYDAMNAGEEKKVAKPKNLAGKRPPKNPLVLQRPPVAERIGEMLKDYDNQFVADAAQLRQVVTNKLLDLAGCGDPRIEIKAAEMLGKISDVGLFSEKTEITVTYNSVSDIDAAIKDKIRKMMKMHAIDVAPIDIDLDAELGLGVPKTEEPILLSEPSPPEVLNTSESQPDA